MYKRRRETTDEEYKNLQAEFVKQDVVKLRLKDFKPADIPDWMKIEGEDDINPGDIYAYALPRWISHTDQQAYGLAVAQEEIAQHIIFYPYQKPQLNDDVAVRDSYDSIKTLADSDPVEDMQAELDRANATNKELERENERLKVLLAQFKEHTSEKDARND